MQKIEILIFLEHLLYEIWEYAFKKHLRHEGTKIS